MSKKIIHVRLKEKGGGCDLLDKRTKLKHLKFALKISEVRGHVP